MNSKLSNIGKWVFGLLALITVALAVYFYLDLKSDAQNLRMRVKEGEVQPREGQCRQWTIVNETPFHPGVPLN